MVQESGQSAEDDDDQERHVPRPVVTGSDGSDSSLQASMSKGPIRDSHERVSVLSGPQMRQPQLRRQHQQDNDTTTTTAKSIHLAGGMVHTVRNGTVCITPAAQQPHEQRTQNAGHPPGADCSSDRATSRRTTSGKASRVHDQKRQHRDQELRRIGAILLLQTHPIPSRWLNPNLPPRQERTICGS